MATSSQEESIYDRRLEFEDRALMVKFRFRPSPLTIYSDEKIRDKLQIYFQKRKFGGGDVDKVIYPLEANSNSAIIVFSIQAEFDLRKLISDKQVQISLPNDVVMIVDITRLPPIIKEVKLFVDPFYLSIIPRGKEDQLKPMLKEVALATLEHTSPNPTISVPTIENVEAVRDVVLNVTGLQSDDKNVIAKKDEKENEHVEYHHSYDAKKYETNNSSPGEVGSDVQDSVTADKSVRPKAHPFHDQQSKPDRNHTEYSDAAGQNHTPSYSGNIMSASSRMAAFLSEGTDEVPNTSGKKDTTDHADGYSDEHASPKNMSSLSRPSSGPFTVYTILFKYLEEKRTGDMNNLRSKYGVEMICKAHSKQNRQGDVYIVCDDKQATNRARCTEEEMIEAGEEFISLYQYNFQRLTISIPISCNGIGDKMITEAKSIICAETPSVMVEDSIDDEVTFVGKESEVDDATKLFVKVTGLQTKQRKLKQNPESNIAYQHDLSQNTSTGSTWKRIPQKGKEYEIRTPEGVNVIVRKDDIVKQNVDVIVNAANTTLNHGMGVAGALRDAAGYGLQDESNEISRSRGYTIKDTDCVYTEGYNLPCQFVVHAVGPMYSSIVTTRQKDDFFEKLERTFSNSFALANTLQARSVAIPLISSGLFGAPKQACAKALVDAIYEYSRNEKSNTIDTMILVNRDDDATDAIQKAMRSRLQNDARSGNRIYGQLDDGGGRSGQTTDGVNFQGASASNLNYSSVGRNTGTYSLTDDDEYGKHFPEFEKNDQHSKRNHQNGTQGHGDIRTAAARGKVENGLDDSDEEDKKCPICLEDFEESKKPLKRLDKCKHKFCEECWDSAMKMKPACPVCGVLYGTITGNQPRGTMDVSYSSYSSVPGYERCGTININYNFPSGRQESNHPEPGAYYSGTRRTAYLPNNTEGKKVLALLRRAFDAKLTFTIGTSHTTGASNTITWNDIHHKTSTHGGTQAFGYPDPTYLKRVTEELAAKGIK